MNEILGMFDSLEAFIEEGSRVPFSDKIVIEERKVLSLLRRIRQQLEVMEQLHQKAQDIFPKADNQEFEKLSQIDQSEWVQSALDRAQTIRNGANEYADYVLSNLQLTISKMQKDLVKLEKNIDSGRELLEKNQQDTPSHETR